MQGGGYDQGFHEIRMKSTGFHVKSKDLLQGIVTLCLLLSLERKTLLVHSPVSEKTDFNQNVRILTKMHQNVPILPKCTHFTQNALKYLIFNEKSNLASRF